ncbi:MAG: S-layer homology domain-containing protein [Cyanobacteria bacterium J06621_8]
MQNQEITEPDLVAQNDCSNYQFEQLESDRLLEFQAEIATILSNRNIDNTAETNTRNQLAQNSEASLIGLENAPSPNKEMAMDLAKLGIFDNLGKDFQLLEPITRGEYIALLYYANNAIRSQKNHIRLAPANDPGFTDINAQHPAYKYVQAFAHSGHSVGYPDNTFKPDQPITREEMIGIKEPLDAGTPKHTDHNIWRFNDFEQIDPKFYRFIYIDHFIRNKGEGSNIQRAFGNIKSFKPKEPVFGYEAIGSLWQFGGHRMPTETAVDIKE